MASSAIEDVLHPQLAYEREHPNLFRRLDEYIAQHKGTKNTKAQIVGLRRKITRYIAYNRKILGDSDFNLFVETISVEDMNDFRDYMVSEHSLYEEQPDFYARYIKEQNTRQSTWVVHHQLANNKTSTATALADLGAWRSKCI